MSHAIDILQDLEKNRIQAMVSGDISRLERIFDPLLLYSHSTGAVDNRVSFLDRIGSGYLDYIQVDSLIDHAVEIAAATLIGTGLLKTKVKVSGDLKQLEGRYVVIWRRLESDWVLTALHG